MGCCSSKQEKIYSQLYEAICEANADKFSSLLIKSVSNGMDVYSVKGKPNIIYLFIVCAYTFDFNGELVSQFCHALVDASIIKPIKFEHCELCNMLCGDVFYDKKLMDKFNKTVLHNLKFMDLLHELLQLVDDNKKYIFHIMKDIFHNDLQYINF